MDRTPLTQKKKKSFCGILGKNKSQLILESSFGEISLAASQGALGRSRQLSRLWECFCRITFRLQGKQ